MEVDKDPTTDKPEVDPALREAVRLLVARFQSIAKVDAIEMTKVELAALKLDRDRLDGLEIIYRPHYEVIEAHEAPPSLWHLKQVSKGLVLPPVEMRFRMIHMQEERNGLLEKQQHPALPPEEIEAVKLRLYNCDIELEYICSQLQVLGWHTGMTPEDEHLGVMIARDMHHRRSAGFHLPEIVHTTHHQYITDGVYMTQDYTHDNISESFLHKMQELVDNLDAQQRQITDARMNWTTSGMQAEWNHNGTRVLKYVSMYTAPSRLALDSNAEQEETWKKRRKEIEQQVAGMQNACSQLMEKVKCGEDVSTFRLDTLEETSSAIEGTVYDAVERLLRNLSPKALEWCYQQKILDRSNPRRVTTVLENLWQKNPKAVGDTPNLPMNSHMWFRIFNLNAKVVASMTHEELVQYIEGKLKGRGLIVHQVDMAKSTGTAKTATVQFDVLLTVNRAAGDFVSGKLAIYLGEGDMRCKLSAAPKLETKLPEVKLRGEEIATFLRALHFTNPEKWTYHALMLKIQQCMRTIFPSFKFGVPRAMEGQPAMVGKKNRKVWMPVDVLDQNTTIAVPMLSQQEADLLTQLADNNGGSILLYEGDTLHDSDLLVKARCSVNKQVVDIKEDSDTKLWTVAVQCYNVRKPQEVMQTAYNTMAKTGMSLEMVMTDRIHRDLPWSKGTLHSCSFPTTTNSNKWSAVGFETYWTSHAAAVLFMEMVNFRGDEGPLEEDDVIDVDDDGQGERAEGALPDVRKRFDPLVTSHTQPPSNARACMGEGWLDQKSLNQDSSSSHLTQDSSSSGSYGGGGFGPGRQNIVQETAMAVMQFLSGASGGGACHLLGHSRGF